MECTSIKPVTCTLLLPPTTLRYLPIQKLWLPSNRVQLVMFHGHPRSYRIISVFVNMRLNMIAFQVVAANDYENPSYTPSKHYTISSSGQVVVVEEAESISGQLDCLNHLDLSCDETLPLPTLEESDESSDISMNVQTTSQTSPVPLLSYELLSPSCTPSSAHDINFHQLLSASLTGESLVSSSSMTSLPNLRHGLLLGSPPLMSLCAHIPATSYHGQAYVAPPIDVVAYEEIVNEDICTPKNLPLMNGSMAT